MRSSGLNHTPVYINGKKTLSWEGLGIETNPVEEMTLPVGFWPRLWAQALGRVAHSRLNE